MPLGLKIFDLNDPLLVGSALMCVDPIILWEDALESGVNYTKMFARSFYAPRSQKHKKNINLIVFFCAFGIARVKGAPKF